MEIAFFCEVAWIHMGDAQLAAGEHTLEIRIPKTKDKDGKPQRILYASDAICLQRRRVPSQLEVQARRDGPG